MGVCRAPRKIQLGCLATLCSLRSVVRGLVILGGGIYYNALLLEAWLGRCSCVGIPLSKKPYHNPPQVPKANSLWFGWSMLVREVGKLDLYLWYKDWLFGRPTQLSCYKPRAKLWPDGGNPSPTVATMRGGGRLKGLWSQPLCGNKRCQGTETIQGNPTVYLKPSQGLAPNWCEPLMISAQCPECQSEEIQLSTGKRREYL